MEDNTATGRNRISIVSAVIVVCCAVIVGLIFYSHHLMIPRYLGDKPYNSLVVTDVGSQVRDETHYYAPIVREIVEGKMLSSAPGTAEHKSMLLPSVLHVQLPAYIVAFMAVLLGSVESAFKFCDFLFPALDFIVFFLIAFKLTRDVPGSILAGTSATILTRYFVVSMSALKANPLSLLSVFTAEDIMNPLYFTRLMSPQVVAFFGFGAVYLICLALEKPSAAKTVSAGIAVGILAYCYVYYATYIPVTAAILLGVYLLKRDWARAKIVFAILVISAVVMLPFAITFFITDMAGIASSVSYSVAAPSPSHVLFCLLAAIIILFAWKGRGLPVIIGISFLCAGLFWEVVPLLTGMVIEFEHYEINCIEPWFFLTVFSGIVVIGARTRLGGTRTWEFILVVLVAGIMGAGVYRQWQYSSQYAENFSLPPGMYDALTWLDENMEMDDVVLTYGEKTNWLIPVYTKGNTFTPMLTLTVATKSELDDRFMIAMAVLDIEPDKFSESFPLLFSFRMRYLYAAEDVRDAEFRAMAEKYSEIGRKELIKMLNDRYAADFIMLTPLQSEYVEAVKRLPLVENVYNSRGYTIFRISGG